MNNELSVSLNLDTSDYEKEINEALKTFATFQKALSDPKLKLNDFQISELSKIFDKFEDFTLSKIKNVQNEIKKITEQKNKVQLEFETKGLDKAWENVQLKTAEEKARLEAEGRTGGASYQLLDINQKDYYEQNIAPYEKEMAAYDEQINKLQSDYNDLLTYLKSNPLEYDFYHPDYQKFNIEIDNIKNGFTRTGQEVKKAKKEVDLFALLKGKLSIFGRIFSQMKNTIAAALNPLNLFRKGWQEIIMSDTSRFGATFKNIGNNVMEYLTPVFETLANLILRCIAYFNQFLKAISGGKIDLFKTSKKSAKEMQDAIGKSKKMLAGFDEINDIGNQGNDKDLPGKWFTEDEVFANSDDIWNDITVGIKNARGELLKYQDELHTVMSDPSAFTEAYGRWDLFVMGIGNIWTGLVDVVAGVWDTIQSLIGMFIDIISGDWEKLGEDFDLFIAGIVEIVGGLGEFIIGVAETVWGLVKGIVVSLVEWIYNTLIVPAGEFFSNLWNGFKDMCKNAIDKAKTFISDMWNGMKNIANITINAIKKGWNSFVNFLKNSILGLANFIKNIPNMIWNGIKWLINSITGGINVLIRGLNKISFDVPDWVPLIGGQKWGFNLPEIPKLNTGTNYVPQDTLAMIHKGEAVVPKEFNSQEFFGTGNDEVVNKLDELIQALENKNMTVNISKQTIGQASVDYQRYENRRLGRRLV